MNRKAILVLFLILIIAAAVIFWPSDRSRIRKLIKGGASAVQGKDADAVMSCFSFNYSDDYGLSYLTLKKGFARVFQSNSKLEVQIDKISVDVDKDKATAGIDLWVIATSGNSTGYLLGDAGNPAHVVVHLEKEHFTWKIENTEKTPSFYF